ncbi:substrate-binding domain-containing protein [Loktanella sp. SALINAS62]|uniref:LacI family DNA-binding transcriptional regulator n=1 Tax=Loktanella sp. SALINAS62 TaxID=2706124 RepID=UPI001B8C4A89|nr:substrate-binding domain-containing protein [Loktanella sp. SALINAS62]MBS1302724.1 LacI family DNA-binding transcriptional regulator [Loktanella sp. SALINAS62]
MTGIRALADSLNISIGTVSRALNGKPGVNPETRDRVLKMAQETGYVANAAGRNLRKGLTNTIGMVIGTGPAAAKGDNNFFMAVTDAMQRAMLERGVDLILLPCHAAMDPLAFLQRTLQRGSIDGLVLTATLEQDPRIAMLEASHLPFITLGRSRTPGNYAWMDLDFEGAARQSVARLAELGHRRIAIGIPKGQANLSALYLESWRQQMQAEGLSPSDDLLFVDDFTEAGGAQVAARLLDQADRPTAILMCSEPMISGFCGGLLGAGVQPGADVSVIGFRQSPLLRHLAPPISCFDMDLDALGEDMAKAILGLVYDADNALHITRAISPMTYVETASVQPLR